jgi:hypothetical protein
MKHTAQIQIEFVKTALDLFRLDGNVENESKLTGLPFTTTPEHLKAIDKAVSEENENKPFGVKNLQPQKHSAGFSDWLDKLRPVRHEVLEWWHGLSRQKRQDYLRRHPKSKLRFAGVNE